MDKNSPSPPEQQIARPIIECPVELGPIARMEWDRIVPELNALGLLIPLDRGALANYCCAYALWLEAIEGIQKFGSMIKAPSGYPVQSPYVSLVNKQVDIMIRLASEIGLTPAARQKLLPPKVTNTSLMPLDV